MKFVWCLLAVAIVVAVFMPTGVESGRRRNSRRTAAARIAAARRAAARRAAAKRRAAGRATRHAERRLARQLERARRKNVRRKNRLARRNLNNKQELRENGGLMKIKNSGGRNPKIMTLEANAPKELKIVSGKYGKDSQQIDVTAILAKFCNGKASCSLRVDDQTFGSVNGLSASKAKDLEVQFKVEKAEFVRRPARQKDVVTVDQAVNNMICEEQEEKLMEQDPEGNEQCVCRAWGDPHYDMFDGKRVNFQGDCVYIVSQTTNADDPHYYKVWAKNMKRSSTAKVSYTEKVWVEFRPSPDSEDLITVMFQQSSTWTLDGDPWTGEGPAQTTWGVKTILSGSGHGHLLWRTIPGDPRAHLELEFNGKHEAHVRIKKAIGKDINGLCGNCDGVDNDFVTATGEDQSMCSKNKYQETVCDAVIGASYLLDGVTTNDRGKSCASPKDQLDCSAGDLAIVESDAFCGFIKKADGPFGDCLRVANSQTVDSIYHSCLEDACQEKEVQFACSALETLHRHCAEKGVYPEYRSAEFCPATCPAGSTYTPKCPVVQSTCKAEVQPVCTAQFTEGCLCDPGFVLDGVTCVERWKCDGKCLYNERIVMANGEKKMFEDCKNWVICANGKIIHEPTNFHEDENADKCVTNAVTSTYDCKRGFIRNNYNSFCVRDPNHEEDPLVEERRKNNEKKEKKRRENRERRRKRKIRQRRNCRKRGQKRFGPKNKGNVFAAGTCETEREEECVCSARGDPHYRPFDIDDKNRQKIDFQGDCSYTLSKTIDDNHECSFHVIGKNQKSVEDRPVSTTRQITIIWAQGKHRAVFGRGRTFELDGAVRNTPVMEENKHWTITETPAGLVWVYETENCRVQASFDGKHEAKIIVSKNMGEAVHGICGSCNDKEDDLVTKEGLDVSEFDKYTRDRKIGASWSAPDPASDVTKCTHWPVDSGCDPEDEEKASDIKLCGAIKLAEEGNPFAECIKKQVVPEEELSILFEECKQDACLTMEDATFDEVFCQKLESMNRLCSDQGMPVQWRPAFAQCIPSCDKSNHEVYRFDAPGCPAVCGGEENAECDNPDTEGCVCDEGYVRSGDECVLAKDCGCTEENGEYHKLNDVWWYGGCTNMRTCVADSQGKTSIETTENELCDEDHQTCVVAEDKRVGCACDQGYQMVDGSCEQKFDCPKGELYSILAPKREDQVSCSDLNKKGLALAEACVCPENHIRMYQGGPCAPAEDACKCTDNNGKKRELYTEWTNADCTEGYRCDLVDSGNNYKAPRIEVTTGLTCTNGVCENNQCNCAKEYKKVGFQCIPICESTDIIVFADDGSVQCLKQAASCATSPDGLITTFDKATLRRSGNCELLLLKSKPSEDCQVSVSIQTQDGEDWIKEVNTVFKKGTKYGAVTFTTHEVHNCTVNDRYLPAEHPLGSMSKIGTCSGLLNSKNQKINAKMYEACGVHVQYDGHSTVKIYLSPLKSGATITGPNPLMGNIEGVCGNANNDVSDDLMTRDGVNVSSYSIKVKDAMILHSFRKDDSCEACSPQAAELRDRDDVCNIYDVTENTPDDLKQCLQRLKADGLTELIERAKLSCRHIICSKYETDRIEMNSIACETYRKLKKECTNRGLVVATEPSSCKKCVCKVNGDPHQYQFDGMKLDAMGNCSYIYVEHKDKNDPCYFRIEADHRDAGTGRVSWATALILHFREGDENHVLRFGQGGSLTFNGEPLSILSPPGAGLYLMRKDPYIVASLDRCGVKASYASDVTSGIITISPGLGSMVRGLCGNCDGNPNNDMIDKDGNDLYAPLKDMEAEQKKLQLSQASQQFGASYLAGNVEDPQSCISDFRPLDCEAGAINYEDPSTCGYFFKDAVGPFSECTAAMTQVELGMMKENCKLDVCLAQNGMQEKIVCDALEALAERCHELDFIVPWRTNTFCPAKCGVNAEWSPAATSCPETCAGSADADCVDEPKPGCQCSHGFVRSQSNTCVMRSQCGCTFEEQYYPLGIQFADSECNALYECENGDLGRRAVKQKDLNQCKDAPEPSSCETVEGVFNCFPVEPDMQ